MAGSNNFNLGDIYNIKKVAFKNKNYFASALINNIIPSSEVIVLIV